MSMYDRDKELTLEQPRHVLHAFLFTVGFDCGTISDESPCQDAWINTRPIQA